MSVLTLRLTVVTLVATTTVTVIARLLMGELGILPRGFVLTGY
ncbi:MAG: hypothetical protein ABI112_11800 [Terracoccus sp.]